MSQETAPSRRFPEEAILVLSANTSGYAIQRQKVNAVFDTNRLQRLLKYPDPVIRGLAQGWQEINQQWQVIGKKVLVYNKVQETADPVLRLIVGGTALEAILNEEELIESLRKLGKRVDPLLRAFLDAKNDLGEATLRFRQDQTANFQKIKAYARSLGPTSNTWNGLSITLDSTPVGLGYLNLTNLSGRPLHNCFMVSRVPIDPNSIREANALESQLGKWMLDYFNLSDETIRALERDQTLRKAVLTNDQYSVVFIPEMPANQRLRISLCEKEAVEHANASEATLSIFADEVALLDLPIQSLAEIQETIRYGRARLRAERAQRWQRAFQRTALPKR